MKKDRGILRGLFAVGVCFVEGAQEVFVTLRYAATGKYDANKYVVEKSELGYELFKKNPRIRFRED